jgi:serine/threonine protein kinase
MEPVDLDAIAHYKVLQRLGAGGMGVVCLAQDTKLGRKVALKLLPPEFSRDAERLNRYEPGGYHGDCKLHVPGAGPRSPGGPTDRHLQPGP